MSSAARRPSFSSNSSTASTDSWENSLLFAPPPMYDARHPVEHLDHSQNVLAADAFVYELQPPTFSNNKGNAWGYHTSTDISLHSYGSSMTQMYTETEPNQYDTQIITPLPNMEPDSPHYQAAFSPLPPPPRSKGPSLLDMRSWPTEFKKPADRAGDDAKKGLRKQPLACLFCRERKISCKRPADDSEGVDQTCNQCSKRRRICTYPTESRRGHHSRHKQQKSASIESWENW